MVVNDNEFGKFRLSPWVPPCTPVYPVVYAFCRHLVRVSLAGARLRCRIAAGSSVRRLMKRIAASVLLVALSVAGSLPAQAENTAATAENMRRAKKGAKRHEKVL